jgi:hypothetical protein
MVIHAADYVEPTAGAPQGKDEGRNGLQVRFVAGTMPNMKDFNPARFFGNVVEHPARVEDNFPQRAVGASRIRRADEGKGGQNENMIQDAIPNLFRRLWIIPGDASADAAQVRNRLVGPNFPSGNHALQRPY